MLSEDRDKLKVIIKEIREGFQSVKLVLYELDEDYLKCLKLFMRKTDKDCCMKDVVKS